MSLKFLYAFRNSVYNLHVLRKSVHASVRLCSSDSASDAAQPAENDMPVAMPNPYKRERQQCILCKMNIRPDYKNPKLLSQFMSPFTGRIYGRHITGLCTKRQEQVESEIVKAQNAGFMPYYLKEEVFLRDPKLFDPDRPTRRHSF